MIVQFRKSGIIEGGIVIKTCFNYKNQCLNLRSSTSKFGTVFLRKDKFHKENGFSHSVNSIYRYGIDGSIGSSVIECLKTVSNEQKFKYSLAR